MTILFWTLLGIFVTYLLTSNYYNKIINNLKAEIDAAEDYINYLEISTREDCQDCDLGCGKLTDEQIDEIMFNLITEPEPKNKTTKKSVKASKKKVSKK